MSPQPLPEPPADYALLVDFPVRPKGQVPHYVYRVHRMVNEPEYFSSSSTWRWDPPPAATPLFGTCYAADRPATALIEALSVSYEVSRRR